MILGSFYFKKKAREALKGNWQTALLITFFSGVFMTLASVLQSVTFPDVMMYASYGLFDELYVEMNKVSQGAWIGFSVLSILSFVLSPVLMLGCNHYFISRMRGEELGMPGLWSRMSSLLRALWLYIVMGVRIFLWSLLLVVPGIIAAIRYSMAPYYMAEDPSISATEAIEKSKHAMLDMKLSYFSLMISFLGWSLVAMMAQVLLVSINVVFALVAAQFMQLAISTYMNGACASFYLTVSSKNGIGAARQEMFDRMRQMGVDPSTYSGEDREEERGAPQAEEDDGAADPKPNGDGGSADGGGDDR